LSRCETPGDLPSLSQEPPGSELKRGGSHEPSSARCTWALRLDRRRSQAGTEAPSEQRQHAFTEVYRGLRSRVTPLHATALHKLTYLPFWASFPELTQSPKARNGHDAYGISQPLSQQDRERKVGVVDFLASSCEQRSRSWRSGSLKQRRVVGAENTLHLSTSLCFMVAEEASAKRAIFLES